jgi:ATP-binding cassette subfamily B protein RaxB
MEKITEFLSKMGAAELPMILQTEATECGLVCVCMVAGFHGLNIDIRKLRNKFPVSLKGATLSHLVKVTDRVGMSSRPLQLDMNEIDQLRLPCIIHWEFNHFVVLKEKKGNEFIVHDPARGKRRLSSEEFSKSFTGVALEIWPSTNFSKNEELPPINLRRLMGKISGLKRSLAQVVILSLVLEVFSLISPLFMQIVLDNVVITGDKDLLITLAIGFGLLLLSQQLITAARTWIGMYVGTSMSIQWRANVFSHLLSLPIQYFEKRHLGDVVSRFGAADTIQQTLTTSLLAAILDGLMTIITLVMMFVYSPMLGWVAVAAMTLYGLGRWAWYQPLRTASQDLIVRSARTQSHFLETMRGVRAIKLFQSEDERRSTWLSLLIGQLNGSLKTQKLNLLYKQLNGLLFGIEGILIIWLGATMVMDGKFTVGMLIAFNSYKGQFNGRVTGLIDNFFSLKMLQLQGERLSDILLTPPEVLSTEAHEDRRELDGSIELKDVIYRYAHGEPTVLDGVNLNIRSGESVAIIGPTGCGKSTLMQVMIGILPATRGNVLIGGKDLSEVGIKKLRNMIATVMQDDVLFAGSIQENIAFFGGDIDHARVEECARIAEIHHDILQMPMGYNTLVGDMGMVLSGGQKQRVLIARALYKRPKILFLDEATCHLDLDRERRLVESLKRLDVTRIVIAHRPETIAAADRVVTLHHGRIVSSEQMAIDDSATRERAA